LPLAQPRQPIALGDVIKYGIAPDEGTSMPGSVVQVGAGFAPDSVIRPRARIAW
jgi:hypothetical protein